MKDNTDMQLKDSAIVNLLPFHLNNSYIPDMVMSTGPGNKQKWLYQKPVTPLYNCGRNELCPCGSGKKYKKCCINKTKPND